MPFRSLLLLSLLIPAFAAAQPNGPPDDVPRGGGNKILVCHNPGLNNEKFREVGLDDLADHALHGDWKVVDTDEDGFTILESLANPNTFCVGSVCDTICGGPRDCNDGNPAINPAASDSDCNAVDDNCSGTADDEYVAPGTSCGVGACGSTGLATCVNGSIVDTCVASSTDGNACGSGASSTCDAPDTCVAGACESNFAPATTTCRPATGQCDVAETCDGAGSCQADLFVAAGTSCGSPPSGLCDVADSCDGAGACVDAVATSGTECRASAGFCDVAEQCDGTNKTCPNDAFEPATTLCRDLNGAGGPVVDGRGVCDVREFCSGNNASCPADGFKSQGVECRAAAGVCDDAEVCTGNGADCPFDLRAGPERTCRPAVGLCDQDEVCGSNGSDCPTDTFVASGTVCRAANGLCDVDDICDGNSGTCLNDVETSGTVCRPAAGVCDAAEKCDGSSTSCPNDLFLAGNTCREAGDAALCGDFGPETCTGGSASCPANIQTVPVGSPCINASLGECNADGSCVVQRFESCENLPCEPGLVCADVLPTSSSQEDEKRCIAPFEKTLGDACTGAAGNNLGDCGVAGGFGGFCCAGGAPAAAGVAGVCSACCTNNPSSNFRCDADNFTCCGSRCENTEEDPEHCGDCFNDCDAEAAANPCLTAAIGCGDISGSGAEAGLCEMQRLCNFDQVCRLDLAGQPACIQLLIDISSPGDSGWGCSLDSDCNSGLICELDQSGCTTGNFFCSLQADGVCQPE